MPETKVLKIRGVTTVFPNGKSCTAVTDVTVTTDFQKVIVVDDDGDEVGSFMLNRGHSHIGRTRWEWADEHSDSEAEPTLLERLRRWIC